MSTEIIEEIKSKIDIVALIGETIKLKKQGSIYVGATSPSSKSGASLKVDPHTQLYNNFAEESGGDVLNWIAYREGLDIVSDFPRIIEIAAEKAGVVLEHQDRKLLSDKALLQPFFRAVAGYYHSKLTEECRAYIHRKWGINDKMIDELLIGWAPENCHLQNELHDLFPDDIMRMSGLFNLNEKGQMRDIFRGRIIFPYWKGGKVVYFIGRDPHPNEGVPKYFKQLVHSETRQYISKVVDNSVFYGEDSIRKADSVIITEGVTDCIKVLQEGLACISPVTVRIKDEQKEYAYSLVKNMSEVIICNDNEDNETGKKGAIATAEYLESRGVPVRVVELPKPDGVDKIDLAEFLQDNSKEDFLQLESNNVWEIKLRAQNIPDKAIDKFRAAKRFIQNELKQMDPAMRKVFIRNDVKNYFGLQITDINEILKNLMFEDEVEEIDEEDRSFFTERGSLRVKKLGEYVMSLHRFITFEDTKNIFHYRNGVYVPGGEDIIARIVQNSLGDASKKRHISEIQNYVQLETLIPRGRVNHDLKRINLLNGLYNLETEQLEPHIPDYISIVQLPVAYDSNAKCPLIEKFIGEVLEPKRVPVIYEFLGYCMIPDSRLEYSLMLLGKGANGKSVMLSLFGEFLGGQNTSAESLHMLEKDPYSTAELYGKLANIFPDLASRAIYENSTFKMLTGNEKEIRAQRKFEHPFKFKNTARLIFSANNLPPAPGDDFAYFRRWIPLKFPNTFEGKRADKNLIDKLTQPEELSGLFNICVKALKKLLQRGQYSFELTTEEVTKLYRINSDPIAQFADDCVVYSDNDTLKSKMYSEFIIWCQDNDVPLVHENVFSKRFTKLGYTTGRESSGERRRTWQNCAIKQSVQGGEICPDGKKQEAESNSSKRPSISLHCSNNQDNTTVCSIDNNSHNTLQYRKCPDAWTDDGADSPVDNDLLTSKDTSVRPDVDENISNSFEVPKKLGTFFEPDETLVSQDVIYSVIRAVMKTTYKREHIVAQCKMLNVSCGGERLDLLKQKGVIHEKPNGDLVWVGG
ncbi:phage/plasmid primase, P4 family [Methanolobus mangrovi]|uniref:Phage/plasmid primase, P4 family n=1 Tax=Methanolobus mangrovi TaxID=3072977 RepID=A0AA51UGX7_9EURY|nr:phage/plasmid primase, P4 family [Methanolobus mangrovi]WMW22763.1 phage/plasmid primase, P4 family [Methanolobus mangrovi]